MALIIGTVLLVSLFASAVVLAVGIPFFMGLMAYDASESRKNRAALKPEDARLRIAAERGVARAFVLAGGVFWTAAVFAGLRTFSETGMGSAVLGALIPAAACAATLIVGWYYERVTAALLAVASFAVVAYGVIYQFELGVWAIMTFVLIGPMATAAVLFWMARREQEALELALALQPELVPAYVSESR